MMQQHSQSQSMMQQHRDLQVVHTLAWQHMDLEVVHTLGSNMNQVLHMDP